MPIFHRADEGVDRASLRHILKDLMEEVQKRSSFTGNDVMVMDNIREAYVRTATPTVISAALLGCWPYLPQAFQTRFLPKFMRFPATKSITGWLSKSMFSSIQTVALGSLAAESVAEHAWFNGLQVAVESQTEVGACITALLSKHQPQSILLKNIPMSAQPLYSSLNSEGPAPQQIPSDRPPQPQPPPAPTAPADPSHRRGRTATGELGRVEVKADDVPEYVLFAMITKQVEARVPEEELRRLDPRRRRRYRGDQEAGAATAPRRGALAPTAPDAWGGVEAAYGGAQDSAQPSTGASSPHTNDVPAYGAGPSAGGGEAGEQAEGGSGSPRRARGSPLPPTAEELAKREEEAVWGWSEAGEPSGQAADAAAGRRRHHGAGPRSGADAASATLADEWSDAFPKDVPRTSDDWSAVETGALPHRGRGGGRVGDPVTGGGYVSAGGAPVPRRRHHVQSTDDGGFAHDAGLDELETAPAPHQGRRSRQHAPETRPATRGGDTDSFGDSYGSYSGR